MANEKPEPGSRAAVEEIAAKTGHGSIPERYTNEGIDKFNEGKETATAYIVRSDYEADLAARSSLRREGAQAESPQDEIARPYVEANPDRSFRWMAPKHIEKRGTRGYQPVYDQKGKKVTHLNEGRYLAHIPKDVKEARLKSYRDRAERNAAAARDAAVEAGRRAEIDSGGAVRMIDPERMTRIIESQGGKRG